MTVLETLDADALSDGTFSPSAPWSTNGTAPDVAAGAAIHGAKGIRWASTGAAGRVMYDTGSNQATARVWSFYFEVSTFASAHQYIGAIYSLTTGGAIQADWRINNTTRTVSLRDSTTAIATSAETLSTGVTYRAEWRVSDSAGTQELRIYTGEGTTPTITLSGAFSSSTARVFAFGPTSAAAGGAIDYDTIKYADDWVGPEAGTPEAPAAPTEVSRIEDACVIEFNHTLDDLTQTEGSASTPTAVTGTTYVFRRGTATRVYEVTYDDGGTSDPLTVTIPPVATGFVSSWPKVPGAEVPTTTWA